MNLIPRYKGWLIAATVLACLLSATAALAVPITYTFSGKGAGDWNGDPFGSDFSSVFFSFTLSGDTSTVDGVTGLLSNGNLTGTINIEGTTGTFAAPLWVFVNQSSQCVGFTYDPTKTDYLTLYKSGVGLDTYNLKTSFGPVSDPGAFFVTINDVLTSAGPLTFDRVEQETLTFSAYAVPVPATLLLLGSGLLGLAGWRRFRRS